MSDSPVQIAPQSTQGGQSGCLIRIAGRATMQHSPAVQELVVQTLDRDPATGVAVDLTDCTYLDSTFLGSLFGLYQRFGHPAGDPPRLTLHAPPATVKALFGPLKLDRVIRTEPDSPAGQAGQWVPLHSAEGDPRTLTQHVMECHRRLAEVDTPARAAFQKIADAMEAELARG